MAEISDRADGGAGLSSGTDLLGSLHTDGDLIDVVQGILLCAGDHADLETSLPVASGSNLGSVSAEPSALHQGINPPPTAAQATPVLTAASKPKPPGKKKSAAAPSSL